MKLSISNITFKKLNIKETLKLLKGLPIEGLELAPSMLWKDPLGASQKERKDVRDLAQSHGLKIAALQALFFNQPQLQLFGTAPIRKLCLERVKGMIDLCADLGGEVISFGAAKNRKRGELSLKDAYEIAVPFFQESSDYAEQRNIVVCLEPLSGVFECDFIQTAREGKDFADAVDRSHFHLLLDTGSMVLNNESPHEMIAKCQKHLYHVQINDPKLLAPGKGGVDHYPIADILRKIHYERWVSLEFLSDDPSALKDDLAYTFECYAK